jgi:hypothetical protein
MRWIGPHRTRCRFDLSLEGVDARFGSDRRLFDVRKWKKRVWRPLRRKKRVV